LKTGKNIRLKHIKDYFIKKLKTDQDQIKKDQEEIDRTKLLIDEKMKDYKKIKAGATVFHNSKCHKDCEEP